MWYVLCGILVVLSAWAFLRYRSRSLASRKPPLDTYVCSHCGEKDCNCLRQD